MMRREYDVVRPAPYGGPVSTTMLTRRRAVDHCRVHSALCRMR